MQTQPVGPNMILVFGRNGEIVGSISKAFGSFYAREVAQRKATRYPTEEQAAAHFGFNIPAAQRTVEMSFDVRGFARAVGVAAMVVAPVAFLCACMSNQATEYGIRAAAMLAGM